MARKCDLCSKGALSGNKVSHSNIKSRTRWLPNLKRVKSFTNGQIKTIYACTRCIKSGFITKPPVRNAALYRQQAQA